MNNFTYRLAVLCLASGSSFAQTTFEPVTPQTALEESTYVVRQQNRIDLPTEACDWALPLLGGQPVLVARRGDLYVVDTKNTDGSLVSDDIIKVGAGQSCIAEPTPELERGYPTGDYGLVSQITFMGKEYTVTGSARLRTDPTFGNFPGEGMFITTISAGIYKSFATTLPPEIVGAMSGNSLTDPLAIGGFNEMAIFTITLYEPQQKPVWKPKGVKK